MYYVAHNVKSTVTISSIFVAFIENMNFVTQNYVLDVNNASMFKWFVLVSISVVVFM